MRHTNIGGARSSYTFGNASPQTTATQAVLYCATSPTFDSYIHTVQTHNTATTRRGSDTVAAAGMETPRQEQPVPCSSSSLSPRPIRFARSDMFDGPKFAVRRRDAWSALGSMATAPQQSTERSEVEAALSVQYGMM